MNLIKPFLRAAKTFPDKTALIIDDEKVSYRELSKMADGFAAGFCGLGVASGDRVSLFMGNRAELAALFLACFRIGAVAVPISCYSKSQEVRYEIEHCGAKLLITEAELYPAVGALDKSLNGLQGIYLVGENPDNAPSLGLPPAIDLARDPVKRAAEDPAVILYTSGSTGASKGVTHTLGSLSQNTRNRCAALVHHPEDTYFISSYLCHGSALTSVFLPMLEVGGTTVLMGHYTPEGFLECLCRNRPTVVGAAPSQIKEVLVNASFTRDAFSSIRYLHVGGDAAPMELFEQYREKPVVIWGVALGMTECGGYLLTPPEGPVKPGSMGLPIPGTEIGLIGEDWQEVPAGEVGQVVVRTGAMMAGYWGDPDSTAQVMREGWLLTGDLARRDQDGYYFFVGRCKNIIVRNSGNVAPVEVEDTLNSNPKVKASGVAGIPDGDHGQMVVGIIVPASAEDPPNEKELDAFTRERLADRKVPGKWIFVDHIPLTPMAKIDRKALAHLALKT